MMRDVSWILGSECSSRRNGVTRVGPDHAHRFRRYRHAGRCRQRDGDGPPGQFFAIIGSSVGSGVSYGGVALGVGADFVILAQGTVDGTGSVSSPLTPPFRGTVLDRYHIQAATWPSRCSFRCRLPPA
jgi:hypothetical protein